MHKDYALTFMSILISIFLTPFSTAAAFPSQPLAIDEIKKAIASKYNVEWETTSFIEKRVVQNGKAPSRKSPEKKLSKGELKVQKMLAKNRAKIKSIRAQEKAQNEAGKESKTDKYSAWIQKKSNQEREWMKRRQREIQKWARERLKLKKEIPFLKKDLAKIPEKKVEVLPPPEPPKVTREIMKTPLESFFIESNFELPSRNQGRRPTCAAFAAVRAIEIMVKKQKGNTLNLSEQWFYYASKPNCQKSPCSSPGSWPRQALLNSKNNNTFDIPLEKYCPYKETATRGNETQIPLNSQCRNGVAKVKEIELLNDYDKVLDSLKAGYAVIGGFKLTEDFYLNDGYVFSKKGQRLGKDSHASGHALLLTGALELPRELWQEQGRYCILVANSWGPGWGKGGHGCLSEKWFHQYRYEIPFIAVKSIDIKS